MLEHITNKFRFNSSSRYFSAHWYKMGMTFRLSFSFDAIQSPFYNIIFRNTGIDHKRLGDSSNNCYISQQLVFLLSANCPVYTPGINIGFFCCPPTVRSIRPASISDLSASPLATYGHQKWSILGLLLYYITYSDKCQCSEE